MPVKKQYELTQDERRLLCTALIAKIQEYTAEIRRYDYVLERLPNDSSTQQLKANAEQQRDLSRDLLGKLERGL